MSARTEKRSDYGEGWDTWKSDLLLSSLADDFVFDDPAMPEPVTKANMADYMMGWKDRVTIDVDGAIVSWHWWSFVGTDYEGSAVTRTTDEGVEYERITYYPGTPSFSDSNSNQCASENGRRSPLKS